MGKRFLIGVKELEGVNNLGNHMFMRVQYVSSEISPLVEFQLNSMLFMIQNTKLYKEIMRTMMQ